jgi:putative ABC transport system permease protein
MGVRKVFGASVADILALIAGDFLKLIVLGLMLACPIVWYLMNEWLQDYAYRITIQPWVFAVTGLSVLIPALATVSVPALKASLAKPSTNLRVE